MRFLDSMLLISLPRVLPALAALAMAMLVVAACDSSTKSGGGGSTGGGSGGTTPSPDARSISALAGRWELQSLLSESIVLPTPISMIIGADGSMSGRSAVNGYSASLDTKQLATGAFEAYPIASTLMAGPPERMELEARYFRGLERAGTWSISSDGALLLHDGEIEVARFRRAAG